MISRILYSVLLCWSLLLSAPVWARGGGGCLGKGTLIETTRGSVPIERLSLEDEILTPEGPVHPLDIIAFDSVDWYEIHLNSRILKATGDHPFFLNTKTIKEASALSQGDLLQLQDGSTEPVTEIQQQHSLLVVYNLVLPDPGVYFANGVWTHNKGCFVPDTPILMADGSQKKISQVQVGDQVLSFDSKDSLVAATVQKVYTARADWIYEIHMKHGAVIQATAEHPFYMGHGTFQTVENLKAGDPLLTLTHLGLTPNRIQSIEIKPLTMTVYNLMTDEPHTFFAAQTAVHNKGGGGGGGGGRGGFGRGSYRSRKCYDSSGRQISCPFDPIDSLLTSLQLIFILAGVAISIRSKVSGSGSSGSGDNENLDSLLDANLATARAEAVERQLKTIGREDLKFNVNNLKKAAELAFLTLQKCWESQQYDEMLPLVMPDLAEQHQAQLRSMIRHHEINRIESLQIHFIQILNYENSENEGECSFSALIEAEAKDYYIDSRNVNFIRGDHSVATFQEIWVFQRRKGQWLLREIEQTQNSNILSLPVPNLPPADLKALMRPQLFPPCEQKAFELSLKNPIWQLESLRTLSRTAAMNFMLSFESQSMERLNGRLTDRFYAVVTKDIEQLINDDGVWEFRNICLRSQELIYVDATGSRGPRFATRLHFHAQRRFIRKKVTLREDADVTPFKMEAWFAFQDGKFLLDDMKVET